MNALLLSLLLSQAMSPALNASSGVRRGEFATTAPLDLFVESTGSDGSPCTSTGAACATLQGALDKIPENVYHPVNVTVGLGNFAGAVLSGKVINTRSGGGAYINILGTLKAATVATGSTTGTLTGYSAGSGATHTVYTDSGQTWTASNLKGKWVQITGGTGATATAFYVIADNTATTITLAGTGTAAVSSTYAILEPGSVITTPLSADTGLPFSISNATAAGIRIIGNESGGNFGNTIVVQKMGFSFTTNSVQCVDVDGAQRVYLRWVHCTSTGTFLTGIRFSNEAGGFVSGAALMLSNSSGAVGIGMGNVAAAAGGVRISSSLFVGGTSGVTLAAPSITLSSSTFFGQTTNALVGGNNSLLASQISNIRVDCNSAGPSARALNIDAGATGGGIIPFGIGMYDSYITNCVEALRIYHAGGRAAFQNISGSSNTRAFVLERGAVMSIDSTTTLTGTTEIYLDNVAHTLADLRAASPKLLTNTYGTLALE